MDFLSADTLPWLREPQQRMRAAFGAGRLPHSLLLLSVPGLGAEQLANWVTALALCESPGERPCDVCGSCRLLRSDSHPDVPPIDALRHAVNTLKTHFGRIDPEWGQVNRIRRGTLDLPIDGGPDIYRAVYGAAQEDGTLAATGGDTLIMFVTWDKAGALSSESINQFGSATLDPHSPHYADQLPLFAAMKTKPVLFNQSQLAGNTEADYHPGDRETTH